jgi:phosphate:Na+ symporter
MYLDELFLEQPALALDQVRRELVRLGGFARSILEQALQVATTGAESDVVAMARADDEIDTLYEDIIRYLGKLSQKNMIQPQPQLLNQFVGIANYLENVGDVMEKDLLAAANKRIRTNLTISPSTLDKLRPIHKQVCLSFDKALAALETGDRQDALDAIESKEEINDLAEEATAHIAKRLVVDEPNRLESFQIETDIIESFRRLNTYTRRIARLSLITDAGGIDSENGVAGSG